MTTKFYKGLKQDGILVLTRPRMETTGEPAACFKIVGVLDLSGIWASRRTGLVIWAP